MMERLQLGVAYHGNRMLKHVISDMEDIVKHNMNLVVHMFTHNDMKRHKNVMKEIFDVTKSYGLDLWVDNWGLGGPPGDVSHILQYFPESHQVFSNGEVNPVSVCFHSDNYVSFTKEWLEMVREAGGEKIFWDEPGLVTRDDGVFACRCPKCQKLYEERYGEPMPTVKTKNVEEFQKWSIGNYFAQVTKYAHDIGCENITCLMPVSLNTLDTMIHLPHMDNVGVDPYWLGIHDPYEYVYSMSKDVMSKVKAEGKKTHIWLQTYDNKAGEEDAIYLAADAAYDAGARSILAWSYRGGEACDYKSANCDMTWHITGDAMRRLKDRYLDEVREEYRKKLNVR